MKGLDVYYPNFDMSCDLEYSTCKYDTICVGNALFETFCLEIDFFGYILYSMSHMSGLKYFEYYKGYLDVLSIPLQHILIYI